MDRTQKAEAVDQLHTQLKETNFVMVAHYAGLTVAEITDLRRKMLTVGASFRVAKNRLAKIALKGTPYEGLDNLFTGPTGITFSADPVSAAKVATDFARDNEKFVLVGGGLGAQVLSQQSLEALAKLPSITELRAKILGMIVTRIKLLNNSTD
jgi:large subunit ribosomal protein L10